MDYAALLPDSGSRAVGLSGQCPVSRQCRERSRTRPWKVPWSWPASAVPGGRPRRRAAWRLPLGPAVWRQRTAASRSGAGQPPRSVPVPRPGRDRGRSAFPVVRPFPIDGFPGNVEQLKLFCALASSTRARTASAPRPNALVSPFWSSARSSAHCVRLHHSARLSALVFWMSSRASALVRWRKTR